jgi:YspA, cpYpsA-related SLOG family
MSGQPSPFELWQQAGGNPEEYRRLMREHGHLVPGKPEPLPCGWPGEEAATAKTIPYRILVTGSRTWVNISLITRALAAVHQEHPDAVLVSGACPVGADRIAEQCWALLCGYSTRAEAITAGRIELHPADWSRYGRAAGPIRNTAMVETGPDETLVFIRGGSAGATHCADAAENAGIPTLRWTAP